ncbi:MAG: leucine-rich repeat protein, partial [Ruminococcus sp.]|nr:leucine-rich repeat protein [Ruminococcus sp.]
NMLFSTDKTIEKYYIVRSYCEILDLFKGAYLNARTTYLSNKTTDNAKAFITYTDMYFTAQDIGSSFGMDFLNTIYSGGLLNKLFSSKEEYEQIVASNQRIGIYLKEAHETVTMSWITDLYTDNSEMYEIYAAILKKNKNYHVYPTRVEFSKDSVEWGLNDSIYYGWDCKVYPSSANCKELTYTSSDTSVLSFLSNGNIQLKKTGTCTITATSVESDDLFDTLEVTVVSGNGADGSSLELLTPTKVVVPVSSDFQYTISNGVTITKYTGSYPNIQIPDTIEGYAVTKIGVNAFYNNKSLASVTMPDSITSIGDYAFSGCKTLSKVTLSKSLQSMGYGVFNECDSLTSVEIPKSLTSISSSTPYVFQGCDKLTNITFENGTTKIASYLFANCDSITSITVPSGVKEIGRYAFYDCDKLDSVNIENGLLIIGSYAFSDCNMLAAIAIPDSVKTIESYAFQNCDRLYSVALPSGILELSSYLFYDCDNLETLITPNNVTKIGNDVFQNCDRLSTIIISDSVTNIAVFEKISEKLKKSFTVDNGKEFAAHKELAAGTGMKVFSATFKVKNQSSQDRCADFQVRFCQWRSQKPQEYLPYFKVFKGNTAQKLPYRCAAGVG